MNFSATDRFNYSIKTTNFSANTSAIYFFTTGLKKMFFGLIPCNNLIPAKLLALLNATYACHQENA